MADAAGYFRAFSHAVGITATVLDLLPIYNHYKQDVNGSSRVYILN